MYIISPDALYLRQRDNWAASRRYWDDHPGRLDFFACKDGTFSCFDAKVNSSKLSKWQAMRMWWMQLHGYEAGVLHVNFAKNYDKEYLFDLYKQNESEKVWEHLRPSCEMIPFNLDNYTNYKPHIPSIEDVKGYNEMKYAWVPIKWLDN